MAPRLPFQASCWVARLSNRAGSSRLHLLPGLHAVVSEARLHHVSPINSRHRQKKNLAGASRSSATAGAAPPCSPASDAMRAA